jgi:hypothetical protein
MAVFSVVAPCSLVEVYQRFKGRKDVDEIMKSHVLWSKLVLLTKQETIDLGYNNL